MKKSDIPLIANGIVLGYILTEMNFTLEAFICTSILGLTIVLYGSYIKRNK